VSSPAEVQERWDQVYQAAEERGGERVLVGAMLQRLDRRRIWSRIFLIGSAALLVGMTTFFYNVLSQ
jgi:hypothetical protein